ncbi:MAG TPA: hypothetical protein VMF06_14710 [Candidatus Limnocylindria bacterium]|nr:hypothetical protein [Candidatus Limnocylindria bacterium]
MSTKSDHPKGDEENKEPKLPEKAHCGLVMPISTCDGCPPEHWLEVKSIITEAMDTIATPKFTVELVSSEDPIGVIHKNIIQNLYGADIIICDVSGRNPNVMFELGLRLAFDKIAVIISDDKTPRSFDTSVIEHLTYPRDLRFSSIVRFKERLAVKAFATYKNSVLNSKFPTFLRSFGEFETLKLNEKAVGINDYILKVLSSIQAQLRTGQVGAKGLPNSPDAYRGTIYENSELLDDIYNIMLDRGCDEILCMDLLAITKQKPLVFGEVIVDFLEKRIKRFGAECGFAIRRGICRFIEDIRQPQQ